MRKNSHSAHSQAVGLLTRFAPYDLEAASTPEPSSLPTLLPPRPWLHRMGAAAWEETGVAVAWDGDSLGGDGAVAWRLRRHQSTSPRPLCSLLAHGRVARGASRSSSSSPSPSRHRSSVPRVRRNARWRENTPRTAEAVPVRDPTATSQCVSHIRSSIRDVLETVLVFWDTSRWIQKAIERPF
jgi:hypothetical protein